MASKQGKTLDLRLKDLIRAVQQELEDSQIEREQNGIPALFQFHNLKIEASVVVSKTKEKDGSIGVKVIEAGLKNTYNEQEVQKVTVELVLNPANSPKIGINPFSPFRTSENRLSDGSSEPDIGDIGVFPVAPE